MHLAATGPQSSTPHPERTHVLAMVSLKLGRTVPDPKLSFIALTQTSAKQTLNVVYEPLD